MESINPATGEPIQSYQAISDEALESLIRTTHDTFQAWKQTPLQTRCQQLLKVSELLNERKEALARLMANEMGKPIRGGRAEVEKCAWVCEYYAEHTARILAPKKLESDNELSEQHYCPQGIILAIMPWNYPFWQVFRFAAPNLAAGNVGLLKHAGNVTACGLAIESLFRDAGFPEHAFRTLLVDKQQIETVISDPRVRGVTLTGSTAAGRKVAAMAGQHLKKTVLELGGSDAYVVLEDADLELAAAKCVKSRLLNSGQSCIAAKRFIVMDPVHDEFVERVQALIQEQVVGDPLDENTDIGPMARQDLRDELHEQVEASIKAGARCLVGGNPDTGKPGAFYPPTLLTGVLPGMPAYEEELFGPVAAIIRVTSEDEAFRVANSSAFGLGGAIFSRNSDRARALAVTHMDTGACFINDFVASDPRLPFGGVKDSGYGRELSDLGQHEFLNIKTVSIA